MLRSFKLPDVGEGLTEGEILQWLVAVGDTVTVNQPLCEVETAKAAVELPSPWAGTVTELLHEPGTTVDVGQAIITIDTGGEAPGTAPAPAPAEAGGEEEPAAGLIGGPAPGGRTSVLVGYGPRTTEARRRPRRAGGTVAARATAPQSTAPQSTAPQSTAPQSTAPQATAPQATAPQATTPRGSAAPATAGGELPGADYGSGGTDRPPLEERPPGRTPLLATAPDATTKPVRHGGLEVGRQAEVHAAAQADAPSSGVRAAVPGHGALRPLAKPPVRKYAKDLGVDLTTVTGTGDGGVITRADIDAALAGSPAPAGFGAETVHAFGAESVPAFGAASGARETRIPIKGVRKHTAAAMVSSAFTAPHVTEFLTVDVTRTMKLRSRLALRPELRGLKISPLLFVAKALLLAVQRHPMINSSWDEAAQEIVVKDYVNLGIAAATPRGLVVPNVKDAGRLSLAELATALTELTETARAGKTSPADMSGGTITITNVGVFGVDTGTPILNPGESAILAFGAIREMPWVHKGKVVPRQVTQLGLSFDHRIVDGELGSQFLSDVGALLADPGTALVF